MTIDVVKYAFVAGELSPTLFGRTDLTKYDFGMAEAQNFFVDYRGGLSTRPGTQFIDYVPDDSEAAKLTTFVFSPEEEDTYLVLFTDERIRFLQGGAYVLAADQSITNVTQASPAVVTSTGHGLAAGRWVKLSGVVGMTELNNRTYEVRNPTANTYELYSVPDGQPVNSTGFGAYTSGGTAKPVYEIASPYTAAQIEGLVFDQYRDQLRITSRDGLPIYNLTRTDHTSWAIAQETFSASKVGPSIGGSSWSGTGSAETLFAVTSVYEDGSESAPGVTFKLSGIVNYPVTEGSVSVNWLPDPDAVYYNVYRSIVSVSEVLTYGSELGYAGRTYGSKFTDPNIVVDFGRVPPNNYDPFSPGAIESVKVTNGGIGWGVGTTVSITDPDGTGFVGRVIVNDAGQIVRVNVIVPGSGYSNPTVVFAGSGSGAVATANARALTGTYPSLSAIYQQRQIYAASELDPIRIWGSQYKRFSNFNFSELALDNDSIEFDLDTAAVTPIRHMMATRGGLLLMTQENVWLLSGGDGKPLTATQALAEPQTYTGISLLHPLRIGEDILYTEGKGYAVRLLNYSEVSRVYGSEDKSILSSHLFGPNKEIFRWGYQESPYKTVWAAREDGAFLAFTIVKVEDVFAWTPCVTQGKVVDLISVREGNEDVIYKLVERFINGRWSKFIERMDLRQFKNVEDAWCVDSGLALTGSSPAGTVTLHQDSDGNYRATISGGSFTGSEGKILRAGNGIFEVTSVTSSTEVVLDVRQEPTNFVPETDDAFTYPVVSGDWTLDSPVSVLSGLWHLEGETVSILGDGNVFPRQQVVNGSITLPQPVTRAIVGLRFTCKAKSLPAIIPNQGIEAKRKRIVAVSIRRTRSRGLKAGDSYDRLYDVKERTNEDWGQPTRLQDGITHMPLGTTWEEDSHTHFLIDDPVPCTLLSIIPEMEVGDDPD